MPVAKETLRIGFTVAAVKGGYVSKEAVSTYGWQDKVTDGPDLKPAEPETATKDAAAPKGKAQKGA